MLPSQVSSMAPLPPGPMLPNYPGFGPCTGHSPQISQIIHNHSIQKNGYNGNASYNHDKVVTNQGNVLLPKQSFMSIPQQVSSVSQHSQFYNKLELPASSPSHSTGMYSAQMVNSMQDTDRARSPQNENQSLTSNYSKTFNENLENQVQ